MYVIFEVRSAFFSVSDNTLKIDLSPTITANGPTSFCQGGSVSLYAGAGYTNYSWSDGVSVVGT